MAVGKFYPTPSTTTYYINEYLIDDLYRVDFSRTAKKQPVYGYASKKFDFVASGKELVTGNIIINYRYPGYLRNIIKENAYRESDQNTLAANRALVSSIAGAESSALKEMSAINTMQTLEDKIKLIANSLRSKELKTNISNVIQNVDITTNNVATANDTFRALKRNFERRYFVDQEGLREPNIEEEILSSPLDEDHKPFDISVRYGFQNKTGGYVRVFRDVYLIGEEQTVSAAVGNSMESSSAQPILEVYSFFCKTIEVKSYEGV